MANNYTLQTFNLVHDLSKGSDMARSALQTTGRMDAFPSNVYEGDAFELTVRVWEDYANAQPANFGATADVTLYIKPANTSVAGTALATGTITTSEEDGENYDTLAFVITAGKTTGFGGFACLLYMQITDTISDTSYQQTISQEISLLSLNGSGSYNPTADEMVYTPADASDWVEEQPEDVSNALDILAHRYQGDVIYGIAGTVTAGKVYYLDGTGWHQADHTAEANGAGRLLCLALGTNASTNGMLRRGYYTTAGTYTAGALLLLGATAGTITTTAPTTSGYVIKPIGHAITSTKICFNPDANYVVIA